MKVFINKGFGVVVNDPEAFQLKRPDLQVMEYEDCLDLQIKDCRLRMGGDDGWTWATRWLVGVAGSKLTTIPCPVTKRECGYTLKEIIKSNLASQRRGGKEKRAKTPVIHIGRRF